MGYIFYAILIYLLYRFVAGFVIPVARTTSHVKKQFNSMKEQMETQQAGQQNGRSSVNGVDQKPKYDVEGEYIKFEEIKD